MIVCDHPDIEKEAQKLLRQTQDAYQLAAELASTMKAKLGSWNRILGAEPVVDQWLEWDILAQASRKAIMEKKMGVFPAVTAMLPELSQYVEASHVFQLGTGLPNDGKKGMLGKPTRPNQRMEADQ